MKVISSLTCSSRLRWHFRRLACSKSKKYSLRREHMCPRVLCQSYSDRSRPRIREPPLTFVLVLKPEGFMTTSSLLDSRCNPFPSPILITDSGRAHRFIALANHLDIRAL